MAVPPYKAGYRRFKWRDSVRNRPVWGDVWFPSNDVSKEIAIFWALGEGKIVRDATLASVGTPFPLVVMSPGASGSAPSYSWLAEYLARHGVIVLGVSHYGESWLYGADTVEPGAVMRLWVGSADCSVALTQLLTCDEFRACLDPRSNQDRCVGSLFWGCHRPGARWRDARLHCALGILPVGRLRVCSSVAWVMISWTGTLEQGLDSLRDWVTAIVRANG